MTYFVLEQLPVPRPATFDQPCPWSPSSTLSSWVEGRALELIYTAWDIQPIVESLGDAGPPFVWDPARRAALRAELDAAMFHVYGVRRDDVEYILSTFPIINRKDPDLAVRVLGAYDRIAKAIESGEPFVSTLNPPPGYGPRHPERV